MIPRSLMLSLALATLAPAVAFADARPGPQTGDVGTQCLDTLGAEHGPVCSTHNASRISTDPDICLCGAGLRTVKVPYCAEGQAPPPQSKAADAVRARAAAATGTLAGVSFEGRAFCVQRGRTGSSSD